MAEHIKIRTAPGTWVVRAGGAVLGESTKALEMTEGEYPPAIYFPREDLAMAFLEKTESSTRCPHKGQATYYTVTTPSEEIVDAGWSYEAPLDAVSEIEGYISFYPERVTVEQL
jgi:uncharacterized protein (DUF427 family)